MAAQKKPRKPWANKPKYDPLFGTRDATPDEKELANRALADLEQNYLRVILVPAPRQNFDGHMIRAVECENPGWYRDFVEGGRINRYRVIRALRRVTVKGLVRRNGFERRLLPLLREREHELFSWRAS